MGKNEDFIRVIKLVSELTEVPEDAIIGHSREYEVVDARWITILLMKERGYTARQISSLIKHPIRTINHAISSISARAKSPYSVLGNTLAIARQQFSHNI